MNLSEKIVELGMVVFKWKSKRNKDITVRYPNANDAEAMWRYINDLSKERTYIRFQGEEISLEYEQAFLESQLKSISQKMAILFLAFYNDELIGITGIEMSDRTDRHIGVLGLSIAKDFRGEGIGSLLMQLVIDEAVKNIPLLEIVTLCVFSSNTLALKMYKKHGFIEYGNLPKGIKLEDRYDDHILMYRSVRKIDEQW